MPTRDEMIFKGLYEEEARRVFAVLSYEPLIVSGVQEPRSPAMPEIDRQVREHRTAKFLGLLAELLLEKKLLTEQELDELLFRSSL